MNIKEPINQTTAASKGARKMWDNSPYVVSRKSLEVSSIGILYLVSWVSMGDSREVTSFGLSILLDSFIFSLPFVFSLLVAFCKYLK